VTKQTFTGKRDSDFLANLEIYCQEAVVNLDAGPDEKNDEISRSILPVCTSALNLIFKKTSAQRLAHP